MTDALKRRERVTTQGTDTLVVALRSPREENSVGVPFLA